MEGSRGWEGVCHLPKVNGVKLSMMPARFKILWM